MVAVATGLLRGGISFDLSDQNNVREVWIGLEFGDRLGRLNTRRKRGILRQLSPWRRTKMTKVCVPPFLHYHWPQGLLTLAKIFTQMAHDWHIVFKSKIMSEMSTDLLKLLSGYDSSHEKERISFGAHLGITAHGVAY